jgi:predicted nucleic acid-binding protein
VEISFEFLRRLVQPIELDSYLQFESNARSRLRGRDEDDWPVLAAALSLNCPIWSEDTDFFGTGHAVWTTNRIEIYLTGQMKSIKPSQDE